MKFRRYIFHKIFTQSSHRDHFCKGLDVGFVSSNDFFHNCIHSPGVCSASRSQELRCSQVLRLSPTRLQTLIVLLRGLPQASTCSRCVRLFQKTRKVTVLKYIPDVAIVKVNFSFVGWANTFSVLSEIRSKNPARTARRAGYISLGLIAALSFLINVAYISAVPKDEIKNSGQLVAALFFDRVFGRSVVRKSLPFMIALSCLGNIVSELSDQRFDNSHLLSSQWCASWSLAR